MNDYEKSVEECGCEICALQIDFEIDEHLLSEIEKHNCVIFAGAGISTETHGTHPSTLYEQIREDIKHVNVTSFPSLIDIYESRPNGRQKLVELINSRFKYINSFRDTKHAATRFHREVSTMSYFKTFITTNWDRYFEEFAGTTPFVYESDVPFWETAERSVLKIHGSIDNYSSIVASSEDYTACEQRLTHGAIGAVLKQIFATKTLIFCGYSAKDEDFLNIFNVIKQGMGAFARTHYMVSPFVSEEDKDRFAKLNIVTIQTDATNLLRVVKSHMISKFGFAKDEAFEMIAEACDEVVDQHLEFTSLFKPAENPHLIFCAMFQDGLIHALQRITDLKHTGEYSNLHRLSHQILAYDDLISEHLNKRDYKEYAYFYGYCSGLNYLFSCSMQEGMERPELPTFFHPGLGQVTKDEFFRRVWAHPEVHKGALKQAQRILKHSRWNNASVMQHMPWG
jgi:SIR2-like domain